MPHPALPVMFGPNITGHNGYAMGGPTSYWYGGGTGALYTPNGNENKPKPTLGDPSPDVKRSKDSNIYIDASRSSNIYSGSKLQPSALSLLPCIRF